MINLNCRTFASETNEFLGPYEASNKGCLNLSFGPVSIPHTLGRFLIVFCLHRLHHSYNISIFCLETTEITDNFPSIQLRSSTSSDLPSSREKKNTKKSNSSVPLQWNPFEDSTPFDQMTEDHIYEAEFDALRDRPSGMYMNQFLFVCMNVNLIQFNILASKASEVNSPVRNTGPVVPSQDLQSPVSQTSQTSSSSISLNGPTIGATSTNSHEEKDETAEDPFAGAPFSIPSGFRRASQKANRR